MPFSLQTEPLSEELAVNGTSYRGEIIVALKFVPPNSSSHSSKKLGRRSSNSKGTLLILVKEAKNLVSPKGTNIPDPFCKGYVKFNLPFRAFGLFPICLRFYVRGIFIRFSTNPNFLICLINRISLLNKIVTTQVHIKYSLQLFKKKCPN